MPFRGDTLEANSLAKNHTSDEMHKFVKEISSAKGYKGISVRNQQAQRTLDRHGKQIDVESRQTAQKMTKKRKELSGQLQALALEKEKIALRKIREKQISQLSMRPGDLSDEDNDDPFVNPYPVVFKSMSRAESVEKLGLAYARSRGGRRRQSREFEDLDINTSTGALLPQLRRGNYMSKSFSTLNTKVPSDFNLSRDKEPDWMGHPEAIGSVRRSRKTAEQLERDSLLLRVSSASKLFSKKSSLPRKVESPSTSPSNVRKSVRSNTQVPLQKYPAISKDKSQPTKCSPKFI